MLRRDRAGTEVAFLLSIAIAAVVLLGGIPGDLGVASTTHGSSLERSTVVHSVTATAAPASPAIHIILPHPTWINVTNDSPGNAPPAVQGPISVYDPNAGATVLFGGINASNDYQNQTWLFQNGVWRNDTNPEFAPPARAFAAADFDPNMGGVLLFGGETATVYLNDTWLFADGIWTNLTADYGPGPSARYGAAMAFDPQAPENGSVLFGGYGYSLTGYNNDTWIWQGGAGWVPLTTNSIEPPELYAPGMAYDASDGYIVLFGGFNVDGATGSSTWELYAGQWWAVTTSVAPPGVEYTNLVYSPLEAGVLLFGGYNYTDGVNEWGTWLFQAGQWSALDPSDHPGMRDSEGFSLDGTGMTPIVVGGFNESTFVTYNDTWAYEFVPGVLIGVNTTSPEVGTSIAVTATPGGGTAPYRAVFSFGDGTYATAEGPGDLTVNHTFEQNASFEVSVTITDAVGASADSGPIDLTVAAPPTLSASATPTLSDVGHSIAFTSTLTSSARAIDSYNWSFGDGSFSNAPNVSHAYATPGVYSVVLNATDGDESTATARLTVTIAPDPSLVVAATSSHPAPGAMTTFFANVSGGTAPYDYSWQFGDGSPGANVPSPVHAFVGSGTYTVQAWANDSQGGTSHETLTVTVGSGAGSSPGGSIAGVPLWFWTGIGALAAVLVVGGVLLARRGRSG
jgi:PKD repeat protein